MPDVSIQGPKVGFVSLGYPKASVDSKQIITQLHAEGYRISGTYDGADLVVVSTYDFIDEVVRGSLDTTGEALAESDKVIVTGCLGTKKDAAGQDIITSVHPEVPAVTGPHTLDEAMEAVHTHPPRPHGPFIDFMPPQGIKLMPKRYAYLKISEDYSHRCSFCTIPSVHGNPASHPVVGVMLGTENLLRVGVKELLVIPRDTSAYGVDIKFRVGFWNGHPLRTHMTELAGALGKLASQYGIWVRPHYVYPYPNVDEVISLMAEGKVLPYLDMPLQHVHPDVLRRMKRPANTERALGRIHAWRGMYPESTIHSVLIVGSPDETEEEFQTLLNFIAEAELDCVGCFTYLPAKGATVNGLPGALSDEVREERRARFMEVAGHVSARRLQRKVDKLLRVLVNEVNQDGGIGRSSTDASETDGLIYIVPPLKSCKRYKTDDFISVKITDTGGHDLWGEVWPI